MARDLNQVFVIGRLVRDPEIKYTPSGTPVTKFSIANNQSIKKGEVYEDYVNYFDVTVWGNQAVNCEKYLSKGKQIAITGELRQSRWTDEGPGQNRSKVEITAHSVQFLGSADNNENQGQNVNSGNSVNNGNQQPNNGLNGPYSNNNPWVEQPQQQQNNGFAKNMPGHQQQQNMSPKDQSNQPEVNPFDNNIQDDDIPF